MSAPTPNWPMVPIHGTYTRTDGQPVTGKIVFTPRATRLRDQAALTQVVGNPIGVNLDNGAIPFGTELPAVDYGNPQGWTWAVEELFDSGATYDIAPLTVHAAAGIDLANYGPVSPSLGAVLSVPPVYLSPYYEFTGSGELVVTPGMWAITLTGNLVITPSGPLGETILLDIVPGQYAATVLDTVISTSGDTVLRKSRGMWRFMTPSAPPETTPPTAPTLAVDNSSQTQLVATFGGGTDNVAVTQYRTRIDGSVWSTHTAAGTRTFAGLGAGSTHTIDAQAGDAAGNWSASTSVTKTTAAPTWQMVFTESFDAFSNGDLAGKTTGGQAWLTPAGQTTLTVNSGKIGRVTPNGQSINQLPVAGNSAGTRFTADYDLSAAAYVQMWINFSSPSLGTGFVTGVEINKSGAAGVLNDKTDPQAGSLGIASNIAIPLTGTLLFQVLGTVVTIKVNGSAIATGTLPGNLTASFLRFGVYATAGGGQEINNLVLEALG